MSLFDSSIPPNPRIQLSFLKTVKLARKNFIQLIINNPSLCLHSQPIFEQNNHRDWAGINITPNELEVPLSIYLSYRHTLFKPLRLLDVGVGGGWATISLSIIIQLFYYCWHETCPLLIEGFIVETIVVIVIIIIIIINSHARQTAEESGLLGRESRLKSREAGWNLLITSVIFDYSSNFTTLITQGSLLYSMRLVCVCFARSDSSPGRRGK